MKKLGNGRGIDLLICASVVTILAGVAVASSMTREMPIGPSEKAKESLLAVRAAGNLIELYVDEHLVYPGPTDGLVPLRSLRQTLDIPAPRYFPEHDGWGHGLLYWSNGFDYMILSEGADGRPEFDYAQHVIPFEGITAGANDSDDQDIILVHDVILRGPFGTRGSTRRTLADMRSIGTACEEYSIDNNFYPNFSATLVPISDLVPHLTPTYIKVLPLEDSWGKPFLYWSNGTAYLIISSGADGTVDAPYHTWATPQFIALLNTPPGTQTDLRKDFLFGSGQFIQWPAGIFP